MQYISTTPISATTLTVATAVLTNYISNLNVVGITDTEADLTFDVSPVVDCTIEISTSGGAFVPYANTGAFASHNYSIDGQVALTSSTTYTIRVTPVGALSQTYTFSTASSIAFSQVGDLISLLPPNNAPLTTGDWSGGFGANWVFFTGNVSRTSTVAGRLRADHLSTEVADLSTVWNIADKFKSSYQVTQNMKFAPNWVAGTDPSHNGGKLGWGFSGGFRVAGSFNVIVTGGNTADTGYSIRWGFRDDKLIAYAYYANRPGMNYPGAPPGTLYGEDIDTGVTIVGGQTYATKMEIDLNTPGNTDGVLRLYVDNVLTVTKTGMIYMVGTPEANRGFFASNNGGSNILNAPVADTYMEYWDVIYSTSAT